MFLVLKAIWSQRKLCRSSRYSWAKIWTVGGIESQLIFRILLILEFFENQPKICLDILPTAVSILSCYQCYSSAFHYYFQRITIRLSSAYLSTDKSLCPLLWYTHTISFYSMLKLRPLLLRLNWHDTFRATCCLPLPNFIFLFIHFSSTTALWFAKSFPTLISFQWS